MTCPQCKGRVPVKALWTGTGLSGVVCPACHASLCPKALCSILLFALSFGLGELTLIALRQRGVPLWLATFGFIVICAGVYSIGAPWVVRLRLKDDRAPNLVTRRGA